MQYRKFRIQNANGDFFELTDKNYKVFASRPNGLGFSKTISTLRLGNELALIYSMINLDQISFELLFYDDSLSDKYQKYNDFINFISHKPLYLFYQKPNSFNWYRRKYESLSLTKTEVDFDDGMLHCDYVVQPLTFWEDGTSQQMKFHISSEIQDGKIYPIEYPIIYGFNGSSSFDLNTLSLLETPLKLTINGTVTNPQYVLYDDKNTIYGRGKFIGTFDSIHVNSIESEEQIALLRNDLILDNPYGYQDLTVGNPSEIFVTFMKLKVGRSKFRFILDEEFEGDVILEWRNRYATV